MDDAGGTRRPADARRNERAGQPRTERLAAAVWLAFPSFSWARQLRDASGWQPEYGWILGAGVTCLAAAWLLSRFGARHERIVRSLAPPRSPRRAPADSPRRVTPAGGSGNTIAIPALAPSGPGLARAIASRPERSAALPRTRPVRAQLGFDTPRRPAGTTAWLHLVSGPSPAFTARAACRVAADLIARGGRVLLIDGGRRCVLHARFALESRWGVGECLTGALPVLGVVQPTGLAGLHLLARGGEPRPLWEALGRLADDAHEHYDHVLVAVDPELPRAAGLALAGRLVEGWWAGLQLPASSARALSERIGIVFNTMEMELETEASLEVAAAGSEALGADAAPVAHREPGDSVTRPVFIPLEALLAGILAPRHDDDDILVLACDDDVRARLKFLKWVRAMSSATPAPPPAWKLSTARS